MTRSILLTGATTPLGLGLMHALLEHDPSSTVLAVGAEAELPDRALMNHPGVTYARVDLTRRRRVWRLLFGQAKALGCEVLVHTALHRSAGERGKRAHALNVESARTLLGMSERHPTLKRFIFRSFAEVYRVDAAAPDIMEEDHPLNFDPMAPQWIRDRVEADLTLCARMGLSDLEIGVLRCSECLSPNMGSQLHDYLQSRVCFHPLGYDPMVNLISLADLVEAHRLAIEADSIEGVFNIPGADTLPLRTCIRKWGRRAIGVPTPLMTPLYRARSMAIHTDFEYSLNHYRFHFNGLLDGQRAKQVLGYQPQQQITWPATRPLRHPS